MTAQVIRTMCPMNCLPTVCGMRVEVDGDAVTAVHGDPDNPESRGFLCIRGRSAGEIVDNPLRLMRPLVRGDRGDAFAEASWEAALDRVAAAMRAGKPERTAVWAGHGVFVNSLGTSLTWRFAHLAGAQWWVPSIVCWGLGGFGAWLTGLPHVNTPDDLAANAELVLLWGANLTSQPTVGQRVAAARRRGARVIAIDVRRTEACDHADDFLLLRPGTDAALALALIHVIIEEGLYNREFLDAHTVGFEQLAAHTKAFTPEWAAAESGLTAERIRDLAREYAACRRATLMLGGSSMHKSANRWHAARAISCLPALTGNLGRPGSGMGPRHGAGTQSTALAGIVPPDARPPEVVIPSEMDTILERLESGSVDVLILPGTNMLSSFADTGRVERALKRVGLVVCFDLFLSDTARRFADVVLPGTSWLEETGLKLGPTHVHLMDQVLTRRGEARPLWELLDGLARRLGIADFFPWRSTEGLIDALLDNDHTRHQTVAGLRAGGPARTSSPDYAYPSLEFPTPSGKVEFYSERAAAMGLPPLPVYEQPEGQDGYPLRFVQGRTLTHFHAFYDHGRALPSLAKADPEPVLWMSPSDAGTRGIEDGARIRIHNSAGEMLARARVTDRMPSGAVWMRDGWLGINRLTSSKPVVTDAAVAAFPQSGAAGYDALVEVAAARRDRAGN
ncbi:MAG: molybdopterin-dependent oxidoreductase [Candidatus Dormibacteraeota bacterium]|nr:molybdopterin-dependent oxidoreductase [Candidatus Dormibacteraeota bacterium]